MTGFLELSFIFQPHTHKAGKVKPKRTLCEMGEDPPQESGLHWGPCFPHLQRFFLALQFSFFFFWWHSGVRCYVSNNLKWILLLNIWKVFLKIHSEHKPSKKRVKRLFVAILLKRQRNRERVPENKEKILVYELTELGATRIKLHLWAITWASSEQFHHERLTENCTTERSHWMLYIQLYYQRVNSFCLL